jgi:orotate phosphoribosyltransferase
MAVVRLRSIATDNDSEVRDELFKIILQRSFRVNHEEPYKLASGIITPLYFNLKATIMDARGGELVARAFLDHAHHVHAESLGGLAIGAVPTLGAIAVLSALDGHPVRTFFVRQAPKEHGTKERIEGLSPDESLDGKRVMIVDDVATAGGSIMDAIDVARAAGALIDTAMVIIDRDKGASKRLADNHVNLVSLFHESDFPAA